MSNMNPSQQGGEALRRQVPITLQAIGLEKVNTINARDLHSWLEVEKDFSNWVKYQIDRARLVQHRDYEVFAFLGGSDIHQGRGGDRRSIEYALTIDAAKHVAMLSQTERGFQAREYFINCERRANDPVHQWLTMTRTKVLRIVLKLAEERDAARELTTRQQVQIQELVPKAAFHDAVAQADGGQSMAEVAKVLGTGQNRLFRLLYEHNILMPANRLPYQEFIDRGYFRVIEQKPWQDSTGRTFVPTKTLVTGKGLAWIQKKWFPKQEGGAA